MSISAHPELKNGVSPNIAFFDHMYSALSAGTSEISLSSITADGFSCVKASLPNINISNWTITADNSSIATTALTGVYNVSPTASIIGHYGWYLNGYYKSVDSILSKTSLSAQECQNELRYFKWTSSLLSPIANSLSGWNVYQHRDQNNIKEYSLTGIDTTSSTYKYITITGWSKNLDENKPKGGFKTEANQLSFTTYLPPMWNNQWVDWSDLKFNNSIKTPLGSICAENVFWVQTSLENLISRTGLSSNVFLNSFFLIRIEHTLPDNWNINSEYNNGSNQAAIWVSIDSPTNTSSWPSINTEDDRINNINSEHRALAVSVNAGAVTGGSDWYWRNIFNTTWTL